MSVLPNPFSYPQFRYFWLARLVTLLAQSSTVMAIGWLVYDLSRQTMGIRDAAFRLGLIGLAQFLPLVAFSLLSGAVIDRVDRRRVALAAVSLQLACTSALAALVWSGWHELAAYFAIAMALGAVRAFYMPTMNAILPNLLPPEVLPRAIAAGAMAARAGAILGPVIGGIAYAISPQAAFGLGAVLLCVSMASILALPPVGGHVRRAGSGVLADFAAGLSFIRGQRVVLGAISLDLVAVLLGGVTALLPVFARDILGVGPQGLGLLRAAPSAGALAAAALFTLRPLHSNIGPKMLGAVAVYGMAIAAFGCSRNLPLSLLLLAVAGWADMVSVFIRQSLVQLLTPDEMRGRVGSISTLSVSASNELGQFESGVLAALVGPMAAVVVGGAGAVAASLLWSRWFPELRTIKRFPALAVR